MWFRPAGDHPRVCGEHILPHHARRTDAGSSPRMRGTRQPRHPQPRTHGIIPAYAGNTAMPNTSGLRTGDHPRVCGEHPNAPPIFEMRVGSSPRMRGTLMSILSSISCVGIIPAYAGNTRRQTRTGGQVEDHPRVCGEHQDFTPSDENTWGSSPRMRGTPCSIST